MKEHDPHRAASLSFGVLETAKKQTKSPSMKLMGRSVAKGTAKIVQEEVQKQIEARILACPNGSHEDLAKFARTLSIRVLRSLFPTRDPNLPRRASPPPNPRKQPRSPGTSPLSNPVRIVRKEHV